jgi:hypothetical protein
MITVKFTAILAIAAILACRKSRFLEKKLASAYMS